MPDFEKIKNNYQAPEVTAQFFTLYKDEDSWLSGWISLDEKLEEFISVVKSELEYSWGSEYAEMNDYLVFQIDVEDKNKLKEIRNEQEYQSMKSQKERFVVLLHTDIKYRIIENIPPVFDWFSNSFP